MNRVRTTSPHPCSLNAACLDVNFATSILKDPALYAPCSVVQFD